MKNIVRFLIALVVVGTMAYSTSSNSHGKKVGGEAANVYCSIVVLQQTPSLTKTLQEDLKDLKCEHSAFMSRGYSLRGEERTVFTSAYSSMVSHCN